MKQTLVPKPKLEIQTKFHKGKSDSLKILTYSNDELKTYLQQQLSENPYMKMSGSFSMENDEDAFLAYDHSKRSLCDEIMEQVHLYNGPIDPELCEYVLSQLDSNGYFRIKKAELFSNTMYSSSAMQHHLRILHTFEPLGCFAFDLKDCLQIQCLAQQQKPIAQKAYILCNYLEDLALHRIEKVKKETGFCEKDIHAAFHFIQACNPKPAANFYVETIYVHPEFRIDVIDHQIEIQLLNDDLALSFQIDDGQESKELTQYLREQRNVIKQIQSSIQKRNMTLLQIMQYICDVQKDFFLYKNGLKHLTLDMISKNCGLHISTISRAIANKSFEFDQRYYALKKMLVSGGTKDIVAEEIKNRMVKLIAHEDSAHPYSDEAIRKLLNNEGIIISRRAVTKYREACFIYNSNKRKKNE